MAPPLQPCPGPQWRADLCGLGVVESAQSAVGTFPAQPLMWEPLGARLQRYDEESNVKACKLLGILHPILPLQKGP